MRSPGRAARIESERPSGTTPTPEVVMKTWSPLPRSTTLVSPVTSATPASSHAARIEATIRLRSASGSPSSRMNAADRKSGVGAADGQVVDRAVDRQPADVAAREEERPDDERIGREGDPRAPSRRSSPPSRTVAWSSSAREHVVAERRHEEPLDQLGRQPAAAAVPEHDPVVPRLRQRAGCRRIGGSIRRRRFVAGPDV